MANRRVLVKRRKSIRNIRKITRTMQLIATARFQAAFNRAVASRPYTEKLAELVAAMPKRYRLMTLLAAWCGLRFGDLGDLQRFLDGEISAVYVTYMRFYSASKQRPETIQLLPLAPTELPAGAKAKNVDYEFRPEPGALLDDLLPAVARIRLFQAFLDAAVSEQIARMVAMKAATEASEEMIKTLSRQYNRARQTQITMELLDIVGGANALA